MSIASEITRISDNIADAYSAANTKGATMPVSQNSDNLSATIATIPTGTTPTGTKSITENGVYDVTEYASADVQVPTTAPAYYIEKYNDNGTLKSRYGINSLDNIVELGEYVLYGAFRNLPSGSVPDFSNITSILNSGLYNAFRGSGITGEINLSSLTNPNTYAISYMAAESTGITKIDLSGLTTVPSNIQYFADNLCRNSNVTTIDLSMLISVDGNRNFAALAYCDNATNKLTSIDLSNLTTVGGHRTFAWMCQNQTGLTTVNLGKLERVYLGWNYSSNIGYAFTLAFSGCTGLTSVDLSSLEQINSPHAFYETFYQCTSLTTVNLSSLTTIGGDTGDYVCEQMFAYCTSLTSIDLPSLTTIRGGFACREMFRGCTSLTTVYIGGTTAIDFGSSKNQFFSMFIACTQNIDVYAPAANQTQIEAMTGYPNFGGTGTVTWHWRS